MESPLQYQVQDYLSKVLGITLRYCHWAGEASFPHHLKETYTFKQCELLNRRFLLCFSRDPELTPAAIEKHLDRVKRTTGLQGIFVANSLQSYNRKRLIERKIPFIIPENQLYLPDLGLDLREHFRKMQKVVEKLSPVSQVVVLSFLLKRLAGADSLTPTGLAKQLPYTKVSMSRSLDELRSLQLIQTWKQGRRAVSRFISTGQEFWQTAKPFLRSPVQKRIYTDSLHHHLSLKAGESALSELTLLSKRRDTWAVSSKEWKEFQEKNDVRTVPNASKDMTLAEFEIWRYRPSLLSDGPLVDPLSLALSLQDQKDERVEIAIDELINTIQW